MGAILTGALRDNRAVEKGLLIAAVVLGLVTAFFLRSRQSPVLVTVLLGVAGAAVGWGGMLLQPDPSPAEIAVTIGALALLVPAHVRVVLGPFGPR